MSVSLLVYLYAFIAGGLITVSITFFELSGLPTLSGIAAIMPVFTWLSYLFIGHADGGTEVSRHAMFVMLGTLFAWLPYMLTIYFLAPRIGSTRSVLIAMAVFSILALIFIKIYKI